MSILEISFSVMPVLGMMLFSFLTGYILRSGQLRSYRRKIIDLEKEMLRNHAEILELQKERADLQRQMKDSRIPVIPMSGGEELRRDRQAK